MKHPNKENLNAWINGNNLNVFQKADAVIEYNKLLAYIEYLELKKSEDVVLDGVISLSEESKICDNMLLQLREMRSTHKNITGYRGYYNSVCDKLDILCSKLTNGI